MKAPRWLWVVVTVGLAALTIAAFQFGRLSVTPPRPSATDVGFSRDMAVHHMQAVRMSELLRERGEDAELRTIGVDMVLTQTHQVGQMQGWLALWGEPLATAEPPMRWMSGHAHHAADEPMAGMATEAELAALEASRGPDADRRYLTLMIDHHLGGVMMADYAVQHAGEPAVRELADSMVRSQGAELETLTRFLDAKGGPLR